MPSTYRILHVLRAPVGGLFRHVVDLSRAQAECGHDVGILADAEGGNALTEKTFKDLAPQLTLGIHRIPISRYAGLSDLAAMRRARQLVDQLDIDIVHGHGAKGGAYARLVGTSFRPRDRRPKRFYTPHGGSLHYRPDTLSGQIYLRLEQALSRLSDGFIFESDFARRTYQRLIGQPNAKSRVIPNGLQSSEFTSHQPHKDAADFLFVGELRDLKGVDVLLRAFHQLSRRPIHNDRPPKAVIVGDGPDAARFKALANELGLHGRVHFAGVLPASAAFPLGKILVMPSRAESLPYIALECAAASMPLIATHVGGLPEIIDGTDTTLVPADDVSALSEAMYVALRDGKTAHARATRLQAAVKKRFTVSTMVNDVLGFYAEVTNYQP